MAEVVPSSRLVHVKLRFNEVKICSCSLHKFLFSFFKVRSQVKSTDIKLDQHIINISKVRLIDQQIKLRSIDQKLDEQIKN